MSWKRREGSWLPSMKVVNVEVWSREVVGVSSWLVGVGNEKGYLECGLPAGRGRVGEMFALMGPRVWLGLAWRNLFKFD
jgi:hypothetical protein